MFRVSRFKDETEGFCNVAAGGPESFFPEHSNGSGLFWRKTHSWGDLFIFFYFLIFLKCYKLDWRVETEKPNY